MSFQRLVSLLWHTHPSWDTLKVESQTSERRERKGNCNTWMPEGLNGHKGWNANRDAVMPLLWQHPAQRGALCSLMLLDTPLCVSDLLKGMCIHDFTAYKISQWTITCFVVIHIMASFRRYTVYQYPQKKIDSYKTWTAVISNPHTHTQRNIYSLTHRVQQGARKTVTMLPTK